MPEFIQTEDFFPNPKSQRGKLSGGHRALLFSAALLLALAAVGFFALVRPARAMAAAIERAVAAETAVPLACDDAFPQVLRQFFRARGEGGRTFSVALKTPDYGALTAEALIGRVDAPTFSVQTGEAAYRQALSAAVAAEAGVLAAEGEWAPCTLRYLVTKSEAGYSAVPEEAGLSALAAARDAAIARCADGLFALLPQSEQLRIAAQKEKLLESVFGDDFLSKQTELLDIQAQPDGGYGLSLRFPAPERLAPYLAEVMAETRAADCVLTVSCTADGVSVSPEETARASAEYAAFLLKLAARCAEQKLAMLASILYAQAGDYKSAVMAFDWNDALHLGTMQLAAVRPDGGVTFFGGFRTAPSRAAAPAADAGRAGLSDALPDWEDVVSLAGTDFNLLGVRRDGTVLSAGRIAVFTPAPAAADPADPGAAEEEEAPAGTWSLGPIDVSGWQNVVSVCASEYFVAGLCADGTVCAVGLVFGGDGTAPVPIDTTDWQNVRALYALDTALLGLTNDGRVLAAGERRNSYGKYGAFACAGWENLVQLAVTTDRDGGHTVLGLCSDGTVRAEGSCMQLRPVLGLLGLPVPINRAVDTSGWKDVVAIGVSRACAVGLTGDGTLLVAGLTRDASGNPTAPDFSALPPLARVQVSAQGEHLLLCGISPDGTPVFAGSTSLACEGPALALRLAGSLSPDADAAAALCLAPDGTLTLLGSLSGQSTGAAPSAWTLW